MNETIISWTKRTWNPVHGCSRVSEGCRNCYAEAISQRYGYTTKPWTRANEKFNVRLQAHKLKEPYRLTEPSLIFVNSMSDLFHPVIPDEYRRRIFDVMNDLPQHTFQILTKRPELAAEWHYGWSTNVWMGVSVENRKALGRIDLLRRCEAKLKWVSFEPLLEDLGRINFAGISWCVVGGESGPAYRRMDHAWARAIRDQAVSAGVAFFFKQSAALVTERGTELVEADGSRSVWRQMPGRLQGAAGSGCDGGSPPDPTVPDSNLMLERLTHR